LVILGRKVGELGLREEVSTTNFANGTNEELGCGKNLTTECTEFTEWRLGLRGRVFNHELREWARIRLGLWEEFNHGMHGIHGIRLGLRDLFMRREKKCDSTYSVHSVHFDGSI
jgi:hypothetical protein